MRLGGHGTRGGALQPWCTVHTNVGGARGVGVGPQKQENWRSGSTGAGAAGHAVIGCISACGSTQSVKLTSMCIS